MLRIILIFSMGFLSAGKRLGELWLTMPEHGDDYKSRKHMPVLMKSTTRLIRDTDDLIERAYRVKLNNLRSIPFEIGYLIYNIQEEYRKMVDKYNTTYGLHMHKEGPRLYFNEYMLYLEEIEYHYWKLDHLINMVHEVERKYGLKGKDTLQEVYVDPEFVPTTTTPEYVASLITKPTIMRRTKIKKKDRRDSVAVSQRFHSTTRRKTRWWWPIEYGWEIDYYW